MPGLRVAPVTRAQLTDPLAIAYQQHMLDERTPANTLRTRMRTLRSVGNPGTASREQLEAWWHGRATRSPATRANDLANLRSFYRWCRLWDHRADDPTYRLQAPRVPDGIPRPAAERDVDHLLEVLDGELRRAVALGARAGLRVAEAATLDWSDVDVDRRRMWVTGKGNKTRQVGVDDALLEVLLPNTGGNVVAAGGQAYTPARLERRVNRAIKRAGVSSTFHKLRHRYATVALEATDGDILVVARVLGHANVRTTQGYVATTDSKLDRIAKAASR